MQDFITNNTSKKRHDWRNTAMWVLCLVALGAGFGAIFFFGLAI